MSEPVGFARPELQEESEYGTNLDFLRRNLRMTPTERLQRYMAGEPGWRKIIEGAAAWRSQRFSNVSTEPGRATSS